MVLMKNFNLWKTNHFSLRTFSYSKICLSTEEPRCGNPTYCAKPLGRHVTFWNGYKNNLTFLCQRQHQQYRRRHGGNNNNNNNNNNNIVFPLTHQRSSLHTTSSVNAAFNHVYHKLKMNTYWIPPVAKPLLSKTTVQKWIVAWMLLTSENAPSFGYNEGFHLKYTLGRQLGNGTFGIVYDLEPNDANPENVFRHHPFECAVKVIPKTLVTGYSGYMRIRQEVEIMSILNATIASTTTLRNVLRFVDAYEDQKNVYLIMEKCLGGDLLPRLTHSNEQLALLFMKDIICAVAQYHQLGIVHRDIKLENVLLVDTTRNSSVKLIDFGSATILQNGQRLDEIIGTPLYTAPEVLLENYSFEADMWSCGILLYRLLSGKFPFEQNELLNEKILYHTISFDDPSWNHVSDEAKDLTKQLLDRDPVRRITGIKALHHPWFSIQKVPTLFQSTCNSTTLPLLK